MSGPSSEWVNTGESRYVLREYKSAKNPLEVKHRVHQQKWVYIDGSYEWRDVPVVVEGE